MRKIIIGLLAVGFVSAGAWVGCSQAADEAAPAATPAAPAAPAATPAAPASRRGAPRGAGTPQVRRRRALPLRAAAAGGPMLGPATPPLELVASTPKGELKNPYNGDIAAIAEEGHHRYLSAGCNGCHGGGGGGGMCPPLTNDTWVYGAADDTLFRLIALGTDGLTKAGYTRLKHEVVVGPMPPFGQIIKTSDDLWRIIAFMRSVNPNSMKLVDVPYAPNPY